MRTYRKFCARDSKVLASASSNARFDSVVRIIWLFKFKDATICRVTKAPVVSQVDLLEGNTYTKQAWYAHGTGRPDNTGAASGVAEPEPRHA